MGLICNKYNFYDENKNWIKINRQMEHVCLKIKLKCNLTSSSVKSYAIFSLAVSLGTSFGFSDRWSSYWDRLLACVATSPLLSSCY